MKKVLISVIAIFAVLAVATTSFATEGNKLDILNELLTSNNLDKGNVPQKENVEEIPNGVVENKNLSTNNNVAKNTNENLPTTTPHTGIGDYSSAIFILVFAASAVYAYKKIKDYNI